jgi:cobalt-zinc-cadmium efflux system outer membrane protein
MQIGTFELLLAKQAEVLAYRDYVTAVRDYWLAYATLERAVGARLAPDAASSGDVLMLPHADAGSPTMLEHHHHGGH